MKNIGILIDIEQSTGKIKQADFGMITLARQKDTRLFAFVINGDAVAVKKDLESFGVTDIVDIFIGYELQDNPDVRAKAYVNAVKQFDIQSLLGLSIAQGKDILPRIAALLEAPLVMDCIDVDLEKNLGKTTQYSGKTIASIKLSNSIMIFGVRSNIIEPAKSKSLSQIIQFDQSHVAAKDLKILKKHGNGEIAKHTLAEADVIIAGGRGMKNAQNFSILFQCAEKLSAAAGASRVAVDQGWVPYSMQVGQTGEKVSPKVYIACGISGSVQHFAGMKTAGMIIALNTDETCSIISNCDYYAVADVLKILPELTKLL